MKWHSEIRIKSAGTKLQRNYIGVHNLHNVMYVYVVLWHLLLDKFNTKVPNGLAIRLIFINLYNIANYMIQWLIVDQCTLSSVTMCIFATMNPSLIIPVFSTSNVWIMSDATTESKSANRLYIIHTKCSFWQQRIYICNMSFGFAITCVQIERLRVTRHGCLKNTTILCMLKNNTQIY